MLANPYPGRFIVVEGIDGSGKSTQLGHIKAWLKRSGVRDEDILITHEPYISAFGLQVRAVLEGKRKPPAQPVQFQELYVRDRKEHLEHVIIPHLRKKGAVVLCDRYFLSTFAYGMAQGIHFDTLMDLHERILGDMFFAPDALFVIDIDPELALLRVTHREGGHPLEYFEKRKNVMMEASARYRSFAGQFPHVQVIAGGRPAPEVAQDICAILKDILDTK